MTTGLKVATDITIADRLSTQLKLELQIKELSEKLAETEAELKKHKSNIVVVTNPNTHETEVSVELNGKVKKVNFKPNDIDYYLSSSEPVAHLMNDMLDILVEPYRQVFTDVIVEDIAAIVKNRMIQKQGRAL